MATAALNKTGTGRYRITDREGKQVGEEFNDYFLCRARHRELEEETRQPHWHEMWENMTGALGPNRWVRFLRGGASNV